jgi:hypothetical protein
MLAPASHHSPPEAADLFDPGVRARLSAPGFRTFMAICDRWALTVWERRRLLGDIGESTYHAWRTKGAPALPVDLLERISLVLGIHRSLRLLFADEAAAHRWLKAPNTDLPFSGDSPLRAMLRGSIDNLYAVRRYIDAWRGVWP